MIELKRGEVPEVVLNNLYKQTQLQDTFGINMVALIDGQPRLLNLKELLDAFLRHRREVVTRRTVFDLRKARERGHVLEGLAVALANVDEFIAIIKAAPTPAVAQGGADEPRLALGAGARRCCAPRRRPTRVYRPDGAAARVRPAARRAYRLSDAQAQAILEMRLQRLTGPRAGQDRRRVQEVMAKIADLLDILAQAGARHADHRRRARPR